MKSNKVPVFWRGSVIQKKHSTSISSDETDSSASENPLSPDNNRLHIPLSPDTNPLHIPASPVSDRLHIKEEESDMSLANYRRMKRLRANDRERRRVHLINCAMESLRDVVPGLRQKRKLTKLDLLRAANQYIWILDESLRTGRSVEDLQMEIEQMQEYSRRFPRICYSAKPAQIPYVKTENYE